MTGWLGRIFVAHAALRSPAVYWCGRGRAHAARPADEPVGRTRDALSSVARQPSPSPTEPIILSALHFFFFLSSAADVFDAPTWARRVFPPSFRSFCAVWDIGPPDESSDGVRPSSPRHGRLSFLCPPEAPP